MDYAARITIESGKRGGKPCIRGLRITAYDVLEYLASGMSEDEILRDFPISSPKTSALVWPLRPTASAVSFSCRRREAPVRSESLASARDRRQPVVRRSVHVRDVGFGSASDPHPRIAFLDGSSCTSRTEHHHSAHVGQRPMIEAIMPSTSQPSQAALLRHPQLLRFRHRAMQSGVQLPKLPLESIRSWMQEVHSLSSTSIRRHSGLHSPS